MAVLYSKAMTLLGDNHTLRSCIHHLKIYTNVKNSFKDFAVAVIWWIWLAVQHHGHNTGKNLDAVTAVTDSFKMVDAFAGDRTGGAVAQTSTQTVDISVRQGRVWVNRLQRMYGSGWWVILRALSAIVDPRDAAVTARGWCSISLVKPNKDSVTTEIPAACNLWNRTFFFSGTGFGKMHQ